MDRLLTRFLPRLETLSDRVVPSCTWETVDGVLTITGDSKANDVQIVDDGTRLTITCDGEDVPVEDGVTDVVVKTLSGADTVSYEFTGGDTAVAVTRDIKVCLGNGWDTFNGSMTGDLAAGSAVDLEVRGNNAKDSLNFDVTGDVLTDAKLNVFLGGGNGKDVVTGDYIGVLTGELTWDVTGGNGKDEAGGDYTFEAGSTGLADVTIFGDRAPDALQLMVFDNSGDDGDPLTTDDASTLDPASTFEVDGGHHKDTADVSDIVDVVSAKEVSD
jgi:hypothetical protein